jgi:cytochrome c5
MKKILLIIFFFLITSCTSIEVLAPPVDNLFISEANVSVKEAEQLRHGREIYLKFCTRCHAARQVDEISEENWEKHIPKMLKKAQLYPDEIIPLKAYLKTAGPINQSLILKREQQKK